MLHFESVSAALADLVVVDLTTVRSGPTCTKILADFGAEVIHVERPGESDRGRVFFDQADLHRNKKSIVLNLQDARGVAVLRRLAARADVVVENYRPDESRTPATVRTPAPPPGTHTREMLGRLGYPPAEIDALAQAGVIEAMK